MLGRDDLEVMIRILAKADDEKLRWHSVALTANSEQPYEWNCVWENTMIIKVKMKRRFRIVSCTDIFIDFKTLKRLGLTLWEDKKEIASQINTILLHRQLSAFPESAKSI